MTPPASDVSRRDFLKGSAALAAAGTLATHLPGAFAGGSDILKVGLVGCGGRGLGAATQAMNADPGARLVAMADMFPDKLTRAVDLMKTEVGEKYQVSNDALFKGIDAYKQVIDMCDVVLLCSPPHFRPAHLQYAVAKEKHIFCEKPVAVDAPGVRSVFATVEEARQKKLSLVSGLCWRYDYPKRAVFEQIHSGAIGNITTIQATYHTSTLKKFARQPEWSEMEFQLRNWQHFNWLSGDHNTEQHVHSIDKVLWAMKDEVPVRAYGTGGRQARTGEESGDIYDHFAVTYEFANGVRAFCSCRQIDGCDNDVSDHIWGDKGYCDIFGHKITTLDGKPVWAYPKKKDPSMYQIEHDELFASIRTGSPINNGDYMTKSTMMAILGRMVAYTGKTLTWDQALQSKEDLTPASYDLGPAKKHPVAIPGITRFV